MRKSFMMFGILSWLCEILFQCSTTAPPGLSASPTSPLCTWVCTSSRLRWAQWPRPGRWSRQRFVSEIAPTRTEQPFRPRSTIWTTEKDRVRLPKWCVGRANGHEYYLRGNCRWWEMAAAGTSSGSFLQLEPGEFFLHSKHYISFFFEEAENRYRLKSRMMIFLQHVSSIKWK